MFHPPGLSLPFSPITPVKNPQCTPVRLRFFAGILEEKYPLGARCPAQLPQVIYIPFLIKQAA